MTTTPVQVLSSVKRTSLEWIKSFHISPHISLWSWVTSDADRSAVTSRLAQLKKAQNGLFRESAYWDLLMMLLLIFTATVTPYEACFMKVNGIDTIFIVNRIVDFGFVLDILRQFNTLIYDDNGEMICNRRKIAWVYLKGWFLVDVLSICPGHTVMSYSTIPCGA